MLTGCYRLMLGRGMRDEKAEGRGKGRGGKARKGERAGRRQTDRLNRG